MLLQCLLYREAETAIAHGRSLKGATGSYGHKVDSGTHGDDHNVVYIAAPMVMVTTLQIYIEREREGERERENHCGTLSLCMYMYFINWLVC